MIELEAAVCLILIEINQIRRIYKADMRSYNDDKYYTSVLERDFARAAETVQTRYRYGQRATECTGGVLSQ